MEKSRVTQILTRSTALICPPVSLHEKSLWTSVTDSSLSLSLYTWIVMTGFVCLFFPQVLRLKIYNDV